MTLSRTRRTVMVLMLATASLAMAGPAFAVASSDRFAVVGQNGDLARGKGVNASTRLSLGRYRVTFNKNVAACVYVATLGTAFASTPNYGELTVAPDVDSANAVQVVTRNSNGVLVDRPFHLFVGC
jgi:hypothetical protein